MDAIATDVDSRLAARIRTLRSALGLSLEALAARSGVSRSMISVIERGESSPTANVLDKLAAGLGVTLASLFADADRADASPLARRADQASWRDPETGYLRRNLSPPGYPSPIELVEIVLPPGARVAYDTGPRARPVQQQVWIIDGAITLTLGADAHRLQEGDCLAMRLDGPTSFSNPGRHPARYVVALSTEASAELPSRPGGPAPRRRQA